MNVIQHEGKYLNAYMKMTWKNLLWHDNTITYLLQTLHMATQQVKKKCMRKLQLSLPYSHYIYNSRLDNPS